MTSENYQPTIRTLGRSMTDIGDPQIRRIVATVDVMATRGQADDLIAPLRQRLGTLRPARPLRLARLLFHPLDPLIVVTAKWRPELGTIPRSAIVQMAAVVKAALGPKAAALEAAIHNRTTDDGALILGLGRSLWPEAGAILIRSQVPDDWQSTNFAPNVYLDLARKIGAVLCQAPRLDVLATEAAHGLLPPSAAAVTVLLKEVAGTVPQALPMMIALLLQRVPQARQLLATLSFGAPPAVIKKATDQAAVMLLDQLSRVDDSVSLAAAPTLAASAAAVGKIAELLNEIAGVDAPPELRSQARQLRQRLDADCKARFAAGLDAELLTPLRELPDLPKIEDIKALEGAARGLRTLEAEARKIGGSQSYEAPLAQAADVIRTLPGGGALQLVDRVRLVEILEGSESALAMLAPPKLPAAG